MTEHIDVLHVDDDPDFADLTKTVLERENDQFTIDTATNAGDGLEMINDCRPDCVISDYILPGMDGIEFLGAVREDHPDLPFILYTGKGSEAVASEAIAANVTDYLQKDSGTSHYAVLANRISNAVEATRSAVEAEERRHRMEQILKTVPGCVVQCDADGQFIFANERAEEVLGIGTDEVTQRAYDDHDWELEKLNGEPIPDEELPFRRVYDTKEPVYGAKHTIAWPDGSRKILSVNAAPLFDETGDVESVVASLIDITEQRDRQRELGLFKQAIEDAADGVAIIDKEEEYVYVDRSHVDMYGFAGKDQLLGNTWRKLYDEDEIKRLEREAFPALEADGRWRGMVTGSRPDGSTFPAELSLTAVENGRVVCTVRDETERQQRERRFQALVKESNDVISIVDTDGEFQYQSPSVEHILGYEPEETIGDTAWEYVHPDDRAGLIQAFERGIANPDANPVFEYRARHADGSWRWLEANGNNQLDNPAVEGYIVNSRDITERKEREQELQHLKEQYELSVEGANLGAWDWNMTTDKADFNEQLAEMLGYSRDELSFSSDTWQRLVHPDDRSSATDELEAHFDGDTNIYDHEIRMQTGGGDWKWIRIAGKAVDRTKEGIPTRVTGVCIDIDDRKQAEQELRANKEQIRKQNAALESLAEIVTDADRTVDQQLTELLELGTTFLDLDIGILSEINGSNYTIRNVVHPTGGIEPGDTFDFSNTYCSLVYDADSPVSFNNPDDVGIKDHPAYEKQELESYVGVPIFVDDQRYGTLNFSCGESRDAPITDAEKSFVRIMAQWIGTELTRRQRQDEIERTSQFLQDTQEVANIGAWEIETRSETGQWSDELHRIHGLPLDANPTPEDGIEFYHPDDRDSIREAFSRLTAAGEPYDLELRIITADGETRWVRTRGEPRYEDGNIVAAQGTVQDITERKSYQQKLERQNERLEEFVSLISHDLRNPLTVALGRVTVLRQMSNGQAATHLYAIENSLDRMEQITEDTLVLAQKGDSIANMEPVSLPGLCRNCWQGVGTVDATLDFEDDIKIKGDANMLKHIFENLFRNAIEHGNDSVIISIGRTNEAKFYVEDNGPGIPVSNRTDVFNPGHTSERDGTGLGLTIVKRLSEAHGWEVVVSDGSDGGARFEFDNVEFVELE